MRKPNCLTILQVFLLIVLFHFKSVASYDQTESLVQCLTRNSENPTSVSQIIYTPDKPSYSEVLYAFAQNLRFETPQTPKPLLIFTPYYYSHVKTAIFCSNQTGLPIRIRSGGHDFEGSSYVSNVTFFIVDTYGFKWISIDAPTKTAWIGAGASLGEVYFAINKTDNTLGFPAGYGPTVCAGGHISGGGYGPITRKYGLAADNINDALIMDVTGNVLDRQAMGEDLFWAIRGGGGSSFGVILAYKINLVDIPQTVTAFTVVKTVENGATPLVYKWQQIAHTLPPEITVSARFTSIVSNKTGKQTVQVTFIALYLGEIHDLVSLMTLYFPELGLTLNDCTTVLTSWIQYFPYHFNLPIEKTAEFLQSRIPLIPNPYFKAKSDFVQQPIPIKGLQKLWDFISLENIPGAFLMEWTPLGGINNVITPSSIPFPHRAGNLFIVWKSIMWNTSDVTIAQKRVDWMTGFHKLMGQYVAKNPRRAYANYRDFDLGVNNLIGKTTVDKAKKWGGSYFLSNFDRLVQVKTKVDPGNFFRFEQSIPIAKSSGH